MLTVAESRASFLAAARRAKASSGCMLGGGNLSGASAANDGGGTLRHSLPATAARTAIC